MTAVTYFVALPILRSEEGDWIAGEPVEAQQAYAAKNKAEALSKQHGGAVAFSRTGDPRSGEFEDAVVIARFGVVPEDLTELMGSG